MLATVWQCGSAVVVVVVNVGRGMALANPEDCYFVIPLIQCKVAKKNTQKYHNVNHFHFWLKSKGGGVFCCCVRKGVIAGSMIRGAQVPREKKRKCFQSFVKEGGGE